MRIRGRQDPVAPGGAPADETARTRVGQLHRLPDAVLVLLHDQVFRGLIQLLKRSRSDGRGLGQVDAAVMRQPGRGKGSMETGLGKPLTGTDCHDGVGGYLIGSAEGNRDLLGQVDDAALHVLVHECQRSAGCCFKCRTESRYAQAPWKIQVLSDVESGCRGRQG